MKIEWNKKYTTISVYSFIVIALSIVFYLITSQINAFSGKVGAWIKVLNPFIIGAVMAYLFNFIMIFYEKKMRKNKKNEINKKYLRTLSLIGTYITVLIVLYIFANFIFPQVIKSITGLLNNIPHYISETSKLLENINKKLALKPEYSKIILEKWNETLQTSMKVITDFVPRVAGFIRDLLSSIWNLILGLIVSIYLLVEKERFIGLSKKIMAALLSSEKYNRALELTRRAHKIFSSFIVGKIVDSLIIGVLTFVILTAVKMPFTMLVSFIIGLTNIIPFFGPFIGAVPSFVIILFESPIKALWFLLIIIIIQQIDGNIIGPKILGDSLGISAFWILFSLLITGKLLGIVGLIIGVPLFTFIYSIVKEGIESKLDKKGLPIKTEEYE